jgi:hypothetical protein
MCSTQAIGARTNGHRRGRALLLGAALGIAMLTPAASAGLSGVGCNQSDLAPPMGVLDLADVNAFVTGFVNQIPLSDLNNDGIFDLADVSLFVQGFVDGCPLVECFPDIRTTIEGALADPPQVQSNYDAINRTIHMFGEITLGDLYGSPPQAFLPYWFERLETLDQCVPGAGIDNAQVAIQLEQLSLAAGPMPLGQVLALEPQDDPAIAQILGDLRDLGFGVPNQAGSPIETAVRLEALPILIDGSAGVTVADLFFKNTHEVTPDQLFAVDTGKSSGLVFAAVCDNDKCCDEDGGEVPGTDRCRTRSEFCNLPPPSRAFCSIASDKCP